MLIKTNCLIVISFSCLFLRGCKDSHSWLSCNNQIIVLKVIEDVYMNSKYNARHNVKYIDSSGGCLNDF